MTLALTDPDRCCGYKIDRHLSDNSLLARDERGLAIVIKKLNQSCLLQGQLHPSIRDRLQFVRELPSRQLATLVSVQRDGDVSFLIWQFVNGRTLSELIAANAPAEAIQNVLRELRIAIDSLHSMGIVHGALHENNVIIDDHGDIFLTHISPLLYHDPQIDEKAFEEIASHSGHPRSDPLQEPDDFESKIHRRRLIAAAFAVAVVGALVALVIKGFL